MVKVIDILHRDDDIVYKQDLVAFLAKPISYRKLFVKVTNIKRFRLITLSYDFVVYRMQGNITFSFILNEILWAWYFNISWQG